MVNEAEEREHYLDLQANRCSWVVADKDNADTCDVPCDGDTYGGVGGAALVDPWEDDT